MDAFALAATYFRWASVGIWAVYTVEWCVRVRRTENWRKYAFSFIGIVDWMCRGPKHA